MRHRFCSRLDKLEAQSADDGPSGPGLAALLAHARRYPRPDLSEIRARLAEDPESRHGLGALLWDILEQG